MANSTFNTAEQILTVLKQENKAYTPYELSIKTGMAFKTVVDCMGKLEERDKIIVISNGRTRLMSIKNKESFKENGNDTRY